MQNRNSKAGKLRGRKENNNNSQYSSFKLGLAAAQEVRLTNLAESNCSNRELRLGYIG